jgi:Flp pilus assembly pilin Flp
MSGDQCRGRPASHFGADGHSAIQAAAPGMVSARGAEPRKENHRMLNSIYTKALLTIAGLRDREEGQALVEYALILSLIAVVSITVLTLLGHNVSTILKQIATSI